MSNGGQGPSKPPNGISALLNTLASGDNFSKLIMMGLIVLSGGANWLETQSGNQSNMQEIKRAITEVHELYYKLMDYERRQTVMMDNLRQILDGNSRQLSNQTDMLENQHLILQAVKTTQDKHGTGP